MSTPRQMSGAGFMVVATMCLALLIVLVTSCYMAATGVEIPEIIDRAMGGLLIGVPALLAKTFRDAGDRTDDDSPAPVELIQDRPVVTREVDPAETLGGDERGLRPTLRD